MTSTPNAAAQDAGQAFRMRPLAIADPKSIDGLRIVERRGEPTLLFSTQESTAGQHQLVIHAAPIASVARATEVARIDRLLPVAPLWDARPVGDSYEVLYEAAGGAVNAIVFQDIHGNTRRVSAEHPFENFGRPHFVRTALSDRAPDVGAIAQLKKLVVFPAGTTQAGKYDALADGADGVVVATRERLVVIKSVISGPAQFDTLPGRLTVSRVGDRSPVTVAVPDFLGYEIDADALGSEVVVFATSKPALLIASRQPEHPFRLEADDRSVLLRLSRPAILVTSQFVHIAAIADPRTDHAVILYGAVPIGALRQ